jgi:hypothetical protein
MTKTYEELAAIDDANDQQDRVRAMHILGLLREDMTPFDMFMFCPSTLDEVKAMTPKERAAVRLSVMQRDDYRRRFGR